MARVNVVKSDRQQNSQPENPKKFLQWGDKEIGGSSVSSGHLTDRPQNESKDNNNAQSSNTTSTSPLELLTWGTVLLELILLLIKLKITEI